MPDDLKLVQSSRYIRYKNKSIMNDWRIKGKKINNVGLKYAQSKDVYFVNSVCCSIENWELICVTIVSYCK